MKQKIIFVILSFIYVALHTSCSAVKRNYHDTCLHYNKYFLADLKEKELEKQLWTSHKDDYNAVLSVYPDCDTNMSKSIKPLADESMKKASLGIDWHGGNYWSKDSWNGESRWADNAFIIIGKDRMYLNDFKNAIETFKYVNTKTKNENDRNEALIWLGVSYTRKKDYFAAAEVFNKLDVEKMSHKNKREYYLAKTYFHAQVGEYSYVNKYVQKAIPLTSRWVYKREKKARLHFIAAQTYQMYGKDSSAYINYQKTVKNNPTYELGFYARLYAAEVSSINSSKQTKRIQKYFKKMLKDPKNKEYNDKIYYEMANFEIKHKRYNGAVINLKKSLKTEIQNPTQKGYSYLKLGELNYDIFKNYNNAKLYYDSALLTLPKTHKDYQKIAKRKNILDEFAKYYNTIVTEDSLQKIAKLSPEKLAAKIDKIIEDDFENQKREFLAAKKAEKDRAAKEAIAKEQNNATFLASDPNAKWYFYNLNSVQNGKIQFSKIWGDRIYEENWRRSVKEKVDTPVEEQIDSTAIKAKLAKLNGPKPDKDGFIGERLLKEELLKDLPLSAEQLEASNLKIQESTYALGKIYHFKLEELENAADQYKTLNKRYPNNKNEGNALYLLYLIYKDSDPVKAEYYKNLLISSHPENEYAKTFIDPNWRQKENQELAQHEADYKAIYNLYETKQYKLADTLAINTLVASPKTPFKYKIELIRVLIAARTRDLYEYRKTLQAFIETNTDKSIDAYAQNLLQQCNDRIQLKEDIEKRWKARLDSVEKIKQDSLIQSKISLIQKNDLLKNTEKSVQETTTNRVINPEIDPNNYKGSSETNELKSIMPSSLEQKDADTLNENAIKNVGLPQDQIDVDPTAPPK